MKEDKMKTNTKTRAHNVLFRADLPFGHKVERDRTKYNRKKLSKKELKQY